MLTKQLIISILATFFFLGLLGTAFAGENDYTSVLGSDQFTFNAPQTKADVAARDHVYNQENLATVGTEAGGPEFTFESAEEAVAGESDKKDAMCSNC